MNDDKLFNLGDQFKNLNMDNILKNAQPIQMGPDLSYINRQHDELMKSVQKSQDEKRMKEEQRDEWLRTIAENVLAIKNNSDGLILSMDDLIQTVVVSNKITEANLLLIEQLLEKIKDNGELNKIDEIKKATLGLATQKGLEVGFVFLLKSLGIL